MNKIHLTFIAILALALNACDTKTKDSKDNSQTTTETSTLAKAKLYLDQEPPGLVPVPFAPGLVSTEHYEYSSTFSPDLKEFYCFKDGGAYKESSLVVFKYIDGTWQASTVSRRVGQPVISPDGKMMHLGRRYKARTATGWSEVKILDAPFSELPIMRLSASANGMYVFDSYVKEDPKFPIRYSRLVDGRFETPQAFGEQINSGVEHFNHPFIAPDESYLLWDAVKEDGQGSSDIYISFKQHDGTWGEAINLGDAINTEAWEASASVTPDGKYLFFSRNVGSDNYENVDIFWVDAQVIETLRPKAK